MSGLVPDYSSNLFPLAIDLFTLVRRNQFVMVGNNKQVAPDLIVATGLSISIADKEDIIMIDKTGGSFVSTSRFLGGTFSNTPVQIGDFLQSQTQVDIFGNPVMYFVDGVSIGILAARLHLSKLAVGV